MFRSVKWKSVLPRLTEPRYKKENKDDERRNGNKYGKYAFRLISIPGLRRFSPFP